jgi:hypothetical protein
VSTTAFILQGRSASVAYALFSQAGIGFSITLIAMFAFDEGMISLFIGNTAGVVVAAGSSAGKLQRSARADSGVAALLLALALPFALDALGLTPPPLLLLFTIALTLTAPPEEECAFELTEKRSRPAMSRAALFASISGVAESPSVIVHPSPSSSDEEDSLEEEMLG